MATRAAGLVINQVYPLGGLVSIVECVKNEIVPNHLPEDADFTHPVVTEGDSPLET